MPFSCLVQSQQSVVCQMSLVLTPIPEGNEFPPFIIKFQSGHSASVVNLGEKEFRNVVFYTTHSQEMTLCLPD